MKKLIAICLVAVMVLTTFTACGNSTDAKNDALDTDTVTIAVPQAFDAFGIPKAPTSTTDSITVCLFDPLLFYPLGSDEPQMRIAESFDKSEDGLTYTFKIRDDVTFHDGSALTAHDVEFSMNIWKSMGSREWFADAEFEVPDDNTFIIHLTKVHTSLERGLYMCYIVPEKAYTEMGEDAFNENPVGSGPYKFESYDGSTKVTLTAYDGYYLEQPVIKTVVYKYISDRNANSTALEAGDIQLSTRLPMSDLEYLSGLDYLQIGTYNTGTYIDAICFNVAYPPFDNVYLRRAISYATDRESMISSAFDGRAEVAYSVVSEVCPDYDPNLKGYEYDLDKAAECLAQAGYPNGEGLGELTIYITSATDKIIAQILQDSLKQIGVTLNIEMLEDNTYVERLVAGNLEFCVNSFGPDSTTSDSYKYLFQKSGAFAYYGISSVGEYDDSKITDLFDKAALEADESVATEIYHEIWQLTVDEALYDTIDYRYNVYGAAKELDLSDALKYKSDYTLKPYYLRYTAE